MAQRPLTGKGDTRWEYVIRNLNESPLLRAASPVGDLNGDIAVLGIFDMPNAGFAEAIDFLEHKWTDACSAGGERHACAQHSTTPVALVELE